MATYNGRRGPNVSEYIANLNTVPPFELSGPNQDSSLNYDEDLALFTNAEFFDFDMGELPSIPDSFEYDVAHEQRVRRENASAFRQASSGKQQASATSLPNDFPQFPDFHNFSSVVPVDAGSASPTGFSPVQSTASYHNGNYAASSTASPITPTQAGAPKRKLDAIVDVAPQHQAAVEEPARVAAEEDKRRRNTAASARFRVKKKQREQALERTAKEMTDKVSVLESRVSQLEMENKWLKSLITEKNSLKGDFTEMYKKLTKDGSSAETSRSSGERTDGVGTTREEKQ